MSQSWSVEFWRLTAVVVAGLLVGLTSGEPFLLLAVGLAAYLLWHLRHLRRLDRWLHSGARGQPPEASGVWDDIFCQLYRQQQRQLKRQRTLTGVVNRFQEATAAMPDATVILDANDEIRWFNDAARRLLGLDLAKDRGQRINNLLRRPGINEFLAEASPDKSLLLPSTVDRNVALSLRIIPYANDQRLLIARDVSQQQQLEKVRRDFVANVSHELRTPLTVVSGCVETMVDARDDCSQEWERPLKLAQQQASRMQQIVEDLLLLSRLESNRNEPPRERVAVPAMLAAIREDAELLSGERAHTVLLESDRELALFGSEGELHSAFANLVSNAVRYTPAGGTITIRWYADAEGAHMEVIDTGPGIPAEHLPRLTERFYRVDVGRSRESGGTGLGLAIVKHVLSRYGAKLRVESVLGKGSTFACDFPSSWVPGGE